MVRSQPKEAWRPWNDLRDVEFPSQTLSEMVNRGRALLLTAVIAPDHESSSVSSLPVNSNRNVKFTEREMKKVLRKLKLKVLQEIRRCCVVGSDF